jgi:cytochrome d ubiquinol oxidase subunit I
VGSYYLWKKKYPHHAKVMIKMFLLLAVIGAPMQILMGDLHGLNTLQHQPRKIAAMEGLWETKKGAGLKLFAIIDQKNQRNKFEIEIPKLGSLILTHHLDGEVKGLKEWPPEEQPPVVIVFWAFRVMVGIGFLMAFVALYGGFLYLRGSLFESRIFRVLSIAMGPSGFIAVLAGWFVTEVGRQPYMVYGFFKTAKGISPVIGAQIAITTAAFVVVYVFVFGAAIYYILKLIKKGPAKVVDADNYYAPSTEALLVTKSGEER